MEFLETSVTELCMEKHGDIQRACFKIRNRSYIQPMVINVELRASRPQDANIVAAGYAGWAARKILYLHPRHFISCSLATPLHVGGANAHILLMPLFVAPLVSFTLFLSNRISYGFGDGGIALSIIPSADDISLD